MSLTAAQMSLANLPNEQSFNNTAQLHTVSNGSNAAVGVAKLSDNHAQRHTLCKYVLWTKQAHIWMKLSVYSACHFTVLTGQCKFTH